MDTNCTQRNASAVVLQSLAMLNSGFVLEQADFFAERVANAAGELPEKRVELDFQIALGRKPGEEKAWSLDSLRRFVDAYQGAQTELGQAEQKALAALCHSLLNTDEFMYVL